MDLVKQLNRIFNPRAIVVVGASDNPDKVGFMCVDSLLKAGFKGELYPVNPNLSELFGLRVYPSVRAIPEEIDLAIITIPARQTISVLEECAAKGIKGTIMFSSGFKELGTGVGLDLQDKIRDIASRNGMKVIGPNCLGIVAPHSNLNATFNARLASTKAGSVAVAAQSGGVCAHIGDALTSNNVGVSRLVSMGNRCNLDFDEIVEYFGEDEETKVIVLYIEGLEKPRQLMSVARRVVRQKPIVVYKVGRTGELNQASLSHTGALIGKHELYEAAFRQSGMIMVNSLMELMDVAKALVFQPPSSGNRVAVLSGTAGLGMILADKCYEFGLQLAKFSPETKQRLRQLVSPLNPIDNPVDLAWTMGFDPCREILRAIMEDSGVDMVAVGYPYATINLNLNQAMLDISKNYRKPITYLCISSFEAKEAKEVARLEQGNIPTYPFPERAITALAGLFRYGKILRTDN